MADDWKEEDDARDVASIQIVVEQYLTSLGYVPEGRRSPGGLWEYRAIFSHKGKLKTKGKERSWKYMFFEFMHLGDCVNISAFLCDKYKNLTRKNEYVAVKTPVGSGEAVVAVIDINDGEFDRNEVLSYSSKVCGHITL